MKLITIFLICMTTLVLAEDNECTVNQDCYDLMEEGIGYTCGNITCTTGSRRTL